MASGRRLGHRAGPEGERVRLGAVRRHPWRFGVGILVVVLLLAALLFAWQANRAAGDLRAAEDRASVLRQHIIDGDVEAARRSLASLDSLTSRARDDTDGPHWWLGAQVPVFGRNVDAVRTAARELDQISDEALPGIVEVADKVQLETFRPKDGRVDLDAVARVAPVLAAADEVFAEANQNVGRFDADRLLGPLREPMATLQKRINSSAKATSAANDAAHLLPSMLGADGEKRRYLMLTLNNAEVRSLGGIAGSAAVITTQDGKLSMGRQGSGSDIRALPEAVEELTEEERLVFQSSTATNMLNTAIHPDFPRAAVLASSIVSERWKQKYDGVIALDPVALSYLLEGLGPVGIGEGVKLTSRNAVSTLLNDVYLKYPTDGPKQDAVFDAAARSIFQAMSTGQGNSQAVVKSLVRAVDEDRLMLWSRDKTEQERIRQTGISGALDTSSGHPRVGVFLNDHAASKMEYYLDSGTTLRSTKCLDGEAQELRTTTTLVSRAPNDARNLPRSILGPTRLVKPGNMRLGVLIFGPRGGKVTSVTVDGRKAPLAASRLNEQHATKALVKLPPGAKSVVVATMRTAAASPGDPELRTTPGARANHDRVGPSACG